MTDIYRVMDQTKSSLAANQLGLATTAHNVANKNTEGFSRQRVDFHAGEPLSSQRTRVGSGVRVGSVTRSANDFINRRLQGETSSLSQYKSQSEIYEQLEGIFQNDSEQGITAAVSQFFNDIRTLSTQPNSGSLRAAVRESANSVASRFKNISQSLHDVSEDIDRRIEGGILEVNSLTRRIAELNNRIMQVEGDGKSHANDERDSRDLAIKQLSQYMDLRITDLEKGGVNVTAKGVGALVTGNEAATMEAHRSPEGEIEGSQRIFLKDSYASNVKDKTDQISGGVLGGLIEVRQKSVAGILGKIDRLAYQLSRSVNGVHESSFSKNGKTGVPFFSAPNSVQGAAGALQLSEAVSGDLSNIAASEVANSAGDNRALLKIASLQDSKVFETGDSFDEFAAAAIGTLGVETRTAFQNFETQSGVVQQLDTLREQTAGVNLDEEAVNMLRFQKGFDASAKLIQVADSMMETVINLKRI